MYCRLFRFPGKVRMPDVRDRWIKATGQIQLIIGSCLNQSLVTWYVQNIPRVIPILPFFLSVLHMGDAQRLTRVKARVKAREPRSASTSTEPVDMAIDVESQDVEMAERLPV